MTLHKEEFKSSTVKHAKPGYIAIVEKYAGPEEKRPVEWIHAVTKYELTTKLADPSIANVIGLIRGRKLEFKESRKVTF